VLARTLAIAAEREDLTLNRAMLADRLAKLVNTVERASAIERGIRSARRGVNDAEAASRWWTPRSARCGCAGAAAWLARPAAR
jgi:hypothetical protein